MKFTPLALFALAVGCTCQGEKPAPGEPAGNGGVPRVLFSAQPRVRGGEIGATSAPASEAPSSAPPATDRERASEAGYTLHDAAAKGCADDKCTGGNCGKLCTQWMDETIRTFKTPAAKNDTYFNCFGACLAGRRDR